MDAHPTSYTGPANRDASRIYQDLETLRSHSSVEPNQACALRRSTMMDGNEQRRRAAPSPNPRIAVVGAGLSGLRCADVLLQHGFNVTIIEARNRIGGRLHQERLPNGHLVDMGPNWIHGTAGNPILDLARQTESAVRGWDTGSCVFDEFGRRLEDEEAHRYADAMWGIVQDAYRHSNKSTNDILPNESLYGFFQQKVADTVPATEVGHGEKRDIVLQMSEGWGAFVGSPISAQSLKFFWLEECLEGENLFCAGTYKNILDSIAEPVLDGVEIQLQTKVERISYCAGAAPKVTLEVEGNRALDFDEVVITAPLGWLQANLDAFKPALPARLAKAIGAIGYGCLEKIYITFPRAFWLGAEGQDHKVQGFVQWLSPSYVPDRNPGRWNQEAVELASLTPDTSHPTLLFYTYGDQSKYLTSEVGKIASREKKDEFLLSFFQPYYSRLPNYSADDADCEPTGCLATDWLHDELAGFGSYSNFQVGLEAGDEDIRVMRQGLPDRGLWFAGEHTAPFVGLGTATGAYWSGESVGTRIAEAYGRARKTSIGQDGL